VDWSGEQAIAAAVNRPTYAEGPDTSAELRLVTNRVASAAVVVEVGFVVAAVLMVIKPGGP